MSDNTDDTIRYEAPTRREYVKYGGAVVGGGLLAGCSSQSDSESTPTQVRTDEEPTETATSGDDRYTVTMEPVGTVEFEDVPETYIGSGGFSADLLVALGRGDGLIGLSDTDIINGLFYKQLPDVSLDIGGVTEYMSDDQVDKEIFYELDPDLIAVDPNTLMWLGGLEATDIEELSENVAPFFGNRSRRKRGDDWPNYPDGPYDYYSITESLTKYGAVFKEQERARQMNSVHEKLIGGITEQLSSDSDRPEIGLVHSIVPHPTNDAFFIYNPISEVDKTYGKKQYRDLKVRDAFAGEYLGKANIQVDFEAMLEADPDTLILHFGVLFQQMDASTFQNDAGDQNTIEYTKQYLREHPIGSELTAVQNDRVFVGGTAYQGPIINLFQTEMLAKQLYPEEYGEWPGSVGDVPEAEQLFDRQRVADIINGDI